MVMTRKEFCATLAGSTVTLWLQGCGGGGDYSGSPAAGGSSCGASGSAISSNHGHVLTIPKADLDSLVDKVYALTGSDHTHTVTFTVAQLGQLKAGASVSVASSSNASAAYGAHAHATVTATVASTCP
jgi:hypothetical protein